MRFTRSLALAALIPALLTGTARAADPEPINVGFFSHLSGPFAEYGASFKNAIELYLDQVKAQGGIEGHPVNLIVEDDRNSPQEAATVARNCE